MDKKYEIKFRNGDIETVDSKSIYHAILPFVEDYRKDKTIDDIESVKVIEPITKPDVNSDEKYIDSIESEYEDPIDNLLSISTKLNKLSAEILDMLKINIKENK